MTASHEIQMREKMVGGKNTWIVDNRVTIVAKINDENSPLLKHDGLEEFRPSLERCISFEDGVKGFCQMFYPILDSPGDYIVGSQMTHERPRGHEPVPLPENHYKRTDVHQWKDPNEKRDHIIQDEISAFLLMSNEGELANVGKH